MEMMQSFLFKAVRTSALSLLIILALLGTAGADTKLSDQERQAVAAVSRSLASIPDRVDSVLASLGFDPVAETIPGFSKWPALRKIETAYIAVVAKSGPDTGKQFLRAARDVIAQDHAAAILSEQTLTNYLASSSPASTVGQMKFEYQLDLKAPQPVDANVREAILIMEKYVDRVPGGMHGAMGRCCGNSSEKAYQILRSSDDRVVALIRAIQEGDHPPEEIERLTRLIQDIAESTHAVGYESKLNELLDALHIKREDIQGIFQPAPVQVAQPEVLSQDDERRLATLVEEAVKAAHAGDDLAKDIASLAKKPDDNLLFPSLSPSDSDANFRAFEDIQESVAKSPGDANVSSMGDIDIPKFTFETMRISGEGFGGVVFGNTVNSTDTRYPKQLIWVKENTATNAANGWGHFDVILSDNVVVSTRRMRTEDAFAAWEILNGRDSAFAPLDLSMGEGVGLASVAHVFPPDSSMVVHPALLGFDLGRSAIIADAIGYKLPVERIIEALKRVGATDTALSSAEKWRTAKKGFYKIIDAPLKIVYHEGLLEVERADDGDYPALLRETGFLDFQSIISNPQPGDSEDSESLEIAKEFRLALPALMIAYPEIERLNSFAEVFAIERWAKGYNADIAKPDEPIRLEPKLLVDLNAKCDLQAYSKNEKGFEDLNLVRCNTKKVLEILRSNGAPEAATRRLLAISEVLQDRARLQVAIDRVTASQVDNSDRSSAMMDMLRGQTEELLVPDPTESGVLGAFVSEKDATALAAANQDLQDAIYQLRTSGDEIADNMDSLIASLDRPPLSADAVGKNLVTATDSQLGEINKGLDGAYDTIKVNRVRATEAAKSLDDARRKIPTWLVSSKEALIQFCTPGRIVTRGAR